MILKLVVENKYMTRTFKMRIYENKLFCLGKIRRDDLDLLQKNVVMDHLLQQAGQHCLQNCCPQLSSKVWSMHVKKWSICVSLNLSDVASIL